VQQCSISIFKCDNDQVKQVVHKHLTAKDFQSDATPIDSAEVKREKATTCDKHRKESARKYLKIDTLVTRRKVSWAKQEITSDSKAELLQGAAEAEKKPDVCVTEEAQTGVACQWSFLLQDLAGHAKRLQNNSEEKNNDEVGLCWRISGIVYVEFPELKPEDKHQLGQERRL